MVRSISSGRRTDEARLMDLELGGGSSLSNGDGKSPPTL